MLVEAIALHEQVLTIMDEKVEAYTQDMLQNRITILRCAGGGGGLPRLPPSLPAPLALATARSWPPTHPPTPTSLAPPPPLPALAATPQSCFRSWGAPRRASSTRRARW